MYRTYSRENSLNPVGLLTQVCSSCTNITIPYMFLYMFFRLNFESRKWLVTMLDISVVFISNADQPSVYPHPQISFFCLPLHCTSYKSSSRITGNGQGIYYRWIAVYLPVKYGARVSLNITLILHWTWKQCFPPKQWYPYTKLNGVAIRKTTIRTVNVVRTPNFKSVLLVIANAADVKKKVVRTQ
jgi:hypothetical protein